MASPYPSLLGRQGISVVQLPPLCSAMAGSGPTLLGRRSTLSEPDKAVGKAEDYGQNSSPSGVAG
eukprot:CAMPEP_0195104276 /NCGR_PEP_ID=MMETSP0448-20130528/73004_1 /TAXON_ID=66468 /ORGANISM="Heterocapsa triquestra, Strain CCMP 448" /LENGTH=64 /DNA_ID=CAMNT_0040140087 /DNA_START=88 /DNA_END=279 /DNA_ORIENTATION=+